MTRFQTRYKVVAGYIILTMLLIATMGYIYYGMKQMTDNDEGFDKQISARRSMANDIMNELNKAEIIVQTIAIGKTDEYDTYKQVMSSVDTAVDSLKRLAADSLNAARLDTVSMLLKEKDNNMNKLMKIISNNDIDRLYRKEIEEMIRLQDSLLALNHSSQKVIKHTHSETVPKKRKNFFKRIGEAFSPSKDSVIIRDTIYEVYNYSLQNKHAISDTIANNLKKIQLRMTNNRQQKEQELNALMQELRFSNLMLNENVHNLLMDIDKEDVLWAQQQKNERERVRRNAAWAISSIASASVLLAGLFMFFIWRDITRSNHYRKELEKAKRHAEDLLDAKEKLMLTITHDIKAPVGSILGYTELLENISTGERQQFYLQNMQGAASHLLQLVNSLLDFHRLDAEKMERQQIPFNAKELFESIIESYRPLADNKGIRLEYDCSDELDKTFTGDPLRIRQITENLIGNALKFTDEGNVALKIQTEEDKLIISVSDTGCGISPEDMERLFKEFTRLDNAQGKEGFGLGLAITSKLVRLLGGKIEVSSKKDEGTVFEVTLPLESSPLQENNEVHSEDAIGMPDTRVLIIDDDPLQTTMMKAMLDKPAITVVSCNHPDELFIHLQQQVFDIIVTDIQMPAMDGVKLIGKIREIPGYAGIPVIAITARSDMNTEKMSAHGFALCINKPFAGKELLKGIAEVIKYRNPDLTNEADDSECGITVRQNKNEADFSQLTAFSMGDKEAIAEIMATFIEETKKKAALLSEAREKNDMHAVTSITHQLLPIFVMVGMTEGKEELEWFEARRNDNYYTEEADRRLETILSVTSRIITDAENEFILKKNIEDGV